MKKKALFTLGGMALALITFVSVTLAGGIGPFSAGIGTSVGTIHDLIKGPEKLPAIDPLMGCDSSATSTNCATIRTSRPAEQPATGLSTATSYTEVASTQQSGKIDDYLTVDNTLKSVSFCGTPLKTRQIIINGVDVAQRIAQLASNDQMGKVGNTSIGEGVCNSMPHNIDYTKGILEIRDVTTFKTDEIGAAPDVRAPGENYRVNIGTMMFAINPTTNEIFNIDAYDGSTLTSVGKLK